MSGREASVSSLLRASARQPCANILQAPTLAQLCGGSYTQGLPYPHSNAMGETPWYHLTDHWLRDQETYPRWQRYAYPPIINNIE